MRVNHHRGRRARQGEPRLPPLPDTPVARRRQRAAVDGDRAAAPAHDPVHVRIVKERTGQIRADQVVQDRLRRAHHLGDELPHAVNV